jgi:tetratricopeptide (TPR) repeat protein
MRMIKMTLLFLSLFSGIAAAQDQMQYGRAYLAEGDNAAAARSYREELDINPFDPVAYNNLAVAKAAQGDYQTALDLLQRAVQLAPKRADIRENLYRLRTWMAQGDGVRKQTMDRPIWRKSSREFPELPALWGSPTASVARDIRPQLKLIKQLHYVPDISN